MISKMLRELLIALVRVYQIVLSPVLGGHCRFEPTCSDYFMDALHMRGVFRGVLLGAWRILRCNPFSKGGFDPVPSRHNASQGKDASGAIPRS
jgi:hypothetical protein